MTLALVLQSCAHAAAPASSPVAASLPADCLDLNGQRELLAGVELEIGEQAAHLARCNVQRGAAVRYGDGQASRAQAAEGRLVWALPVTGVGSAIVAAVVTALVMGAVQQQHPAAAK